MPLDIQPFHDQQAPPSAQTASRDDCRLPPRAPPLRCQDAPTTVDDGQTREPIETPNWKGRADRQTLEPMRMRSGRGRGSGFLSHAPSVLPLPRRRRRKLSQSSFELPGFPRGLRRQQWAGRGLGSAADWVRIGRSARTRSQLRGPRNPCRRKPGQPKDAAVQPGRHPLSRGGPARLQGGGQRALGCGELATLQPGCLHSYHWSSSANIRTGCTVESIPHLGCEVRLQRVGLSHSRALRYTSTLHSDRSSAPRSLGCKEQLQDVRCTPLPQAPRA